ncbi:serine/threonine-protein kinase [Actinopolymorpha alba]|uniref:serine/threonine-protein kinase n=1 Tax=Actinopolymorpha alba TaxID=533267 RepID=UPI00068840CF|nr:serine/threonine-protein kinase [Actinopolymorpha alba]
MRVRPDGEVDDRDPQGGGGNEQRLGGRFRVEASEVIPEGRNEVTFAYDEELGRRVVLKRTDPGEARAYAKLAHPHIVTVHDVLTVHHGPRAGTWLVMEHVPNGSLSGRTFTVREAARIGVQIADALAALHRTGLVHCDVKPANIVLTDDETAKLTDFDAARRLGGIETLSPDRPISYTPDYAAPELVGGNPQTASDVFSLGATVYALVAGVSPRRWAHGGREVGEGDHSDPDDQRTMNGQAHHGVVEMTADVGPLRPVLTAMLRTEPDKRPAAAEAHRLLRDITDPPTPWRRIYDAAASRWRTTTTGRRRAVGAGAGALAVATVALIALLVWQSDRDSTPAASSSHTSADPSSSSSESSKATTGPRVAVSRGPATTYGNSCKEGCAYVEFQATGLEPGTKYRFVAYTSGWGEFNSVDRNTDENGMEHEDEQFPCNAVGQQVWIVAEGPDGKRIVSNKLTWTRG